MLFIVELFLHLSALISTILLMCLLHFHHSCFFYCNIGINTSIFFSSEIGLSLFDKESLEYF